MEISRAGIGRVQIGRLKIDPLPRKNIGERSAQQELPHWQRQRIGRKIQYDQHLVDGLASPRPTDTRFFLSIPLFRSIASFSGLPFFLTIRFFPPHKRKTTVILHTSCRRSRCVVTAGSHRPPQRRIPLTQLQ